MAFAINLCFPLVCGRPMCGPGGRAGLVLAVAAYWALGRRACHGRARGGRALVYGAILMAFSQVLPVAQIAAGPASLSTWAAILGEDGRPLSVAGGFFVTAMTGGLLIAAAFACGWLFSSEPSPRVSAPRGS